MDLSDLEPKSSQTLAERYDILLELGVSLYDERLMGELDLSGIHVDTLFDNSLKRVYDFVRSSFKNIYISYFMNKDVCKFAGGGAEKIFGFVPYDNPDNSINIFREDLDNILCKFDIPVLDRAENNLDYGLSGDIHFLYFDEVHIDRLDEMVLTTNEKKRSDDELMKHPEFSIFALPSRKYLWQDKVIGRIGKS